jgi:hypothetical protein
VSSEIVLRPTLWNEFSSPPSFSLTATAAPAITTTNAAAAAARRPNLRMFLPFPGLDARRVRLASRNGHRTL